MIPIELMKDKKLDWTNKALLTEILALHKLPNGCIASNEHFADLLGIKSPAASKRITKLKKLGYISTEDVYNKRQCVGRIITPLIKITLKKSSNDEIAHPEKKERNSEQGKDEFKTIIEPQSEVQSFVNTQDLGTSGKNNNTPIPEEPEGTSQTIIGVLPDEPEGTSLGNTISSSINTDIKSHLLIQYTGETELDSSYDFNFTPENASNIFSKENVEEFPDENSSSTLCSEKSKQNAITIAEYRDIMNDFFYGYPDWEPELLKLGLEEFIRRTPHYHLNKEEYIGMIREFFEL